MVVLSKHLCEYTLDEILFGKGFKLNLCRWKKVVLKISNNEVSTNESLSLNYG